MIKKLLGYYKRLAHIYRRYDFVLAGGRIDKNYGNNRNKIQLIDKFSLSNKGHFSAPYLSGQMMDILKSLWPKLKQEQE